MFFVGIAALVRAWSYPAQTKMMPIIYSVALIILSFLLGVRSIRKEKSSEENVVQTEEPLSRVFFVGGIIFAYRNTRVLFLDNPFFVLVHVFNACRVMACHDSRFSRDYSGYLFLFRNPAQHSYT